MYFTGSAQNSGLFTGVGTFYAFVTYNSAFPVYIMALEKLVQEQALRIQSCHAKGQVVAFFDFDRTLINGYSAAALAREYLRSGNQRLRGVAREVQAVIEGERPGRGYLSLYRSLVSAMAGVRVSTVSALAQAAFERSLEGAIYREARQLIRLHRQLGHKVVIISTASRFQVQAVGDILEVDEICCTELVERDGRLTGDIDGEPCFGEAKVIAARRMARRYRAPLKDAWFYSDSHDDLPLLNRVGHPVPTNPSRKLSQIAEQKDWISLNFCSRGPANLESVLRTAMMANVLATTVLAGAGDWLLSRSPQQVQNRMSSWLGDTGVGFAGLEFEIDGIEHLESARPAIFVFNHQSYLDAIVMAYLIRHDFAGLCKQEVAQNPVLGPLLRAHGTIFVDREGSPAACLEKARDTLAHGKSLVIAPEGTRSATGLLGDFKKGAFYLARRARVPIIPVVLHNVSDALPKGQFLLRPATVQVTVMPPIYAKELRHPDGVEQLRETYKHIMRSPFGSRQATAPTMQPI
jgi:putative phosphoserine phosphatase/1-acylglycerol-3-phosphate O-acyltransferase